MTKKEFRQSILQEADKLMEDLKKHSKSFDEAYERLMSAL